MARVIVRKQMAAGSNDIAEQFNKMLSGEGDEHIIQGKLEKLTKLLGIFKNNLKIFAESPIFINDQENKDQILGFVELIADIVEQKLSYVDLKDSAVVRNIMQFCGSIGEFKSQLDIKDLKDKWIFDMAGDSFVLFSFADFDLKKFWIDDNFILESKKNPEIKTTILKMISIMYSFSKSMFDIISSPDIDIKVFSNKLIEAIDHVRHQPDLHRCGKAFDLIKNSVSMLETNFGTYHKDMLESQNPISLVENFIIDVSTNQKNKDPVLIGQFRQILKFYRKQSSSGKQNPQTSKILDQLNKVVDQVTDSKKE